MADMSSDAANEVENITNGVSEVKIEPGLIDSKSDPPQVVQSNGTESTDRKDQDIENSPKANMEAPADIRQMTIKNLDTGEEFIIGENDPDFEFDTFELCADRGPATTPEDIEAREAEEAQRQQYSSWWRSLLDYIFTSRRKDSMAGSGELSPEKDDSTEPSRVKTPFTKLSSFKFRKELGRGAFGRVLLAEARTDGKLYALKIISKKNMRNSDKRQAKTERDILLAMGHKAPHPFTTGLRFAFQSENNLYLGMDFLPGGNLKELIKRFGSLPEDWTRLYAAELTLAISHLHSLHVIYRDIKPHNVMIDSHGHIVLIDFGLSKQDISHPRGAMSLVGTPDYSAPEVLKTGVYQIEQSNKAKKDKKKPIQRHALGAANKDSTVPSNVGYGKAADWWSLGVMIYEMLAGLPAFRGSDLRQTYQKVLYAEVDFAPEEKFSVEARLLLLGLLKKDPGLRLGSWENPPKDIMEHSFFKGIQWDVVYQRQHAGPWVPEPVNYGRKSGGYASAAAKASTTAPSPTEPEGPAPALVLDSDSKVTNDHPVVGSSVKKTDPVAPVDRQDSDERDSLAGRPSELVHLRDSIVAFSKGHQENRIADWSFFDETILASAARLHLQQEREKINLRAQTDNKSTESTDS